MLTRKMKVFNSMNVVTEEELKQIKSNVEHGTINLIFRFLHSPETINPDKNNKEKVGSITFVKNKLFGYCYRQIVEVDDSQSPSTEKADLVFSCIGYKSIPIQGEPFDETKSRIPNVNGCILTDPFSTYYKVGKYAVGWVKSGATGVIDSTLKGSEESFNNMILHNNHGKLEMKEDPLIEVQRTIRALSHKDTDLITSFDDWTRINEEEIRLGELEGRCRVKLNSYDQIRQFLH